MLRRIFMIVALAAMATGCNGGSTSPPPFFTGVAAPTPTPTPAPTSASGTLTTSTTASSTVSLGPVGPGNMGTASCPASSAVAHLTVVFSVGQPTGTPTIQSMRRRPRTIGGTALTPFGYFTVTPDVNVNCPNTPAFAMTFPTGATLPSAPNSYLAMYDPGNPSVGWNTISGPGTLTGNTLSWTTYAFPYALVAGRAYSFVLFTNTTMLAIATPSPTPIPLHLYVHAEYGFSQHLVRQYNLPIASSTQAPNIEVRLNGTFTGAQWVAIDPAGDMVTKESVRSYDNVPRHDDYLRLYPAPLTNASTPTPLFNTGTAPNIGRPAFMSTGDFWAATDANRVSRFNAPFNSSAPAAFVTDAAMRLVTGVAVDAAQNLYIANTGAGNDALCPGTRYYKGAACASNLLVYAPPYTGAPIVTPLVAGTSDNPFNYGDIAVSATQLYVVGNYDIDVYTLPITTASRPAFRLGVGWRATGLAVDPAGNLYVSDSATVKVYAPPLTVTSGPSVVLSSLYIAGIAVGK